MVNIVTEKVGTYYVIDDWTSSADIKKGIVATSVFLFFSNDRF